MLDSLVRWLVHFQNILEIMGYYFHKNNLRLDLYLIDIRKELLNLYSDAEDLPDPWIKLLCIYNLFIIEDKAISKDSEILKTYPGDIYTYGLIVNYQNSKKFMLGISPHWRY
jgi:hypothetical protein